MIFDIKLRALHEKRIQFPIAAPLPVMPYYTGLDGEKKPVLDMCTFTFFFPALFLRYLFSDSPRQRLAVPLAGLCHLQVDRPGLEHGAEPHSHLRHHFRPFEAHQLFAAPRRLETASAEHSARRFAGERAAVDSHVHL
jgi:hypothetical protein